MEPSENRLETRRRSRRHAVRWWKPNFEELEGRRMLASLANVPLAEVSLPADNEMIPAAAARSAGVRDSAEENGETQ